MQRATQNPPAYPAWQYDGTNWSTIDSEAEAMGWPIDGTVNADTTVTLKVVRLGQQTTVTVHATDWVMPQGGANQWSVLTAAQFSAQFTVVVQNAELDKLLF